MVDLTLRLEKGAPLTNLELDNNFSNLAAALSDSNAVSISDTPPLSPNPGDLWWDSTSGQLKIYYEDADSSQWVDASVSVPTQSPSSSFTWIDYATGFSATPTLTQTIADGDVYTYTYSNGTLYRLVPSGSEQDAFYTTFSGGVLSGLVASKGVTI